MALIKWKRPSGNILTTNDREETIEYCLSLGFEPIKEKKKKPKKKE